MGVQNYWHPECLTRRALLVLLCAVAAVFTASCAQTTVDPIAEHYADHMAVHSSHDEVWLALIQSKLGAACELGKPEETSRLTGFNEVDRRTWKIPTCLGMRTFLVLYIPAGVVEGREAEYTVKEARPMVNDMDAVPFVFMPSEYIGLWRASATLCEQDAADKDDVYIDWSGMAFGDSTWKATSLERLSRNEIRIQAQTTRGTDKRSVLTLNRSGGESDPRVLRLFSDGESITRVACEQD